MSHNKLKEFIKKLVREYTGTGASGGNAGDGNSITSPRPFPPGEEMENYILKNVYGGEGGQWVGDKASSTFNRFSQRGMFENEDQIRKFIKNEIRKYYGVHDTYDASPGQTRNLSGRIGVWEELQEQMTPEKQEYFANRKIDFFEIIIDIEVRDKNHINNIIAALRILSEVSSLERIKG